jgi:hypothetical protein
MRTEYRLALCTREEALTHSIGSQQYQSLMRRSAAEFGKTYDTYRAQFIGLHARLWQAASLCDAREFEEATRICNEVLKLPTTTPNITTLHARAMHFLLVAMIDGQLDEPKKAVELAGKWLSTADQKTRRSDSAACIMWEQARAMYVASLPDDSDLPYPTASPPDMEFELVESLRMRIRALLKWPRISAGPFEEHAAALETMLNKEFPDSVGDGREQKQSLYFATPLLTLPPGDYIVTAEVKTVLDPETTSDEAVVRDYLVGTPATVPKFEETFTMTGELTVPGGDLDAAEFKRLAVLAIVTKSATNDDFELQTSSPAEVDISELISRSGQLKDVAKMRADARESELYLDELRRAGKKWVMCAHLDHQNVDVKIHTARALAKLADPDTAAVLAIAAKRNAYGVMGSENATLHSIYQAELKLALEAATRLKLTPAGLFLTYEHKDEVPQRTVVHHSELNPEMFRTETDFARIDEWLRNVYLADSQADEKQQSELSDTGLIGRVSIRTVISNGPGKSSTIKQIDPGYIFQYTQGQFFHRDVLPLDVIGEHHFAVNLNGQLLVPRDMVVKIWHAGGGVSHDECGLYVDGRLLGVVGDNRDKHNIYEVPLLKGRHDVRWELSGGTFRTNVLLFQDPETEQLLPITNAGPESVRKDSKNRVVRIQSSRTDWPVSAKPDWLPKNGVTTDADPVTSGVGQ